MKSKEKYVHNSTLTKVTENKIELVAFTIHSFKYMPGPWSLLHSAREDF